MSGLSGLSGLSGVSGLFGSFLPSDIEGFQLWLRADAGTFQDSAKTTAAVSDADVVGAWADQSGNGNDALQSTTSKKPTLRLTVLNNLPIIRFDGGDGLVSSSVSLAGQTIFVVFRASVDGMICEHSANADAQDGSWFFTDNSLITVRRGGTRSKRSLSASWGSDNVWRVATHRHAGTLATNQVWLDGILQVLGDISANDVGIATVTDIFSIASRNAGSVFMTGDIAEIVVYNSALSAGNRQRVENYLNARYAIF